MPYYPEDVVNEVFSENDIVDYASRYVRLKKVGNDYSGLCPFHKEKSPSFHVSREKQLFHCFGCGASGNLVQFVMRAEGLDFVEALKLLAQRAGIELPEGSDSGGSESQLLKKKVYEMNKISARFYFDILTKAPEGKIGYAYFTERGILPKTITSYGLGFAPDSYTALKDHLSKLGYTDEDMLKAGLLVKREDKLFDKFRNRVMFPIIDLRGNVIGFGGRIMGQSEENNGFKLPKYLNSAETPVFNKGKNLFSLNLAKKSSPYSIILVEGYMDVISVYQAGITNVVATLGTALTENQAKLLMKYCNEILICYDSDEAGQKATIRAIDIINSVGGRSRVIKLKGAKDPDEYIRANGSVMFQKAVSEAVASTQFRLSILRSKYSLDSPEGKALYISEATEALQSLTDAVTVDAYINQIATETQISKEAIQSEYRKKAVINSTSQKNSDERELKEIKKENESVFVAGEQSQRILNVEKKLIFLMHASKKYIDEVKKQFKYEEFSHPIHQKIVRMIYEAREANKLLEPSMLLNEFSGNDVNYVSSIFYNFEEFSDSQQSLSELIINMKIDRITAKMSKEKDVKVVLELTKQLNELKKELENIKLS